MMSDFREIDERLFASPQIQVDDLTEARALGVTMIINNRPEDESPDQTPGPVIETAARAAGMDYVAIPVTHAGFGPGQVEAMRSAMDAANGKVLAYCRSGTRSTLLWALAEAKAGKNPAVIASKAGKAGYDISPIRQMVEMLSAGG